MGKVLGSLTAVSAALLACFAVPSTPAAAETPVCSAKKCAFVAPNRTVCTIVMDSAGCGWSDGDKWYAVKLFPNGGLDPCLHLVDGPGRQCDLYPGTGLPALGYGQTAVLGPYTCSADPGSVTCIVNPAGRGFTINNAGIIPAAVAPPPPPPDATAPPSASPAPDVSAVAPAPVPPPPDLPAPVIPGPAS